MTLVATEVVGRTTALGYGGQGTQATRVYHVLSDSRIYGFDAVSGLPNIGDAHPGRSSLKCTLVTADESEQLDGGKWLWTVTAQYSTVSYSGGAPVIELPTEREPILTWSSRLVEIGAMKDLDGKPFLNTAGDPYLDPMPTIVEPHAILTASYNSTYFDGSTAQTWLNKVNNTAWKGGDRGTVLIEDISAQQKFEESTYWEVSMTFHFNPRKWIPFEVPSRGPHYFETQEDDSVKLVCNRDDEGNLTTEPCYLDSTGAKITPEMLALLNVQPHYQQFRLYSYAEFSQLGL